jgi:hypothetical protein
MDKNALYIVRNVKISILNIPKKHNIICIIIKKIIMWIIKNRKKIRIWIKL